MMYSFDAADADDDVRRFSDIVLGCLRLNGTKCMVSTTLSTAKFARLSMGLRRGSQESWARGQYTRFNNACVCM